LRCRGVVGEAEESCVSFVNGLVLHMSDKIDLDLRCRAAGSWVWSGIVEVALDALAKTGFGAVGLTGDFAQRSDI
jgi:hypothetical protein